MNIRAVRVVALAVLFLAAMMAASALYTSSMFTIEEFVKFPEDIGLWVALKLKFAIIFSVVAGMILSAFFTVLSGRPRHDN